MPIACTIINTACVEVYASAENSNIRPQRAQLHKGPIEPRKSKGPKAQNSQNAQNAQNAQRAQKAQQA
jgi:hypothetical protein